MRGGSLVPLTCAYGARFGLRRLCELHDTLLTWQREAVCVDLCTVGSEPEGAAGGVPSLSLSLLPAAT